ncbi:restriction endonuclease subunit S [Vibrio breoganii]
MKSDINLKHLAKLEVLPSGWAHSSVGELCIIEPVGNKKLAQKKYLEHGDYPVVDQGAAFIGGYSNDKDLVIDPPKNSAYLVFGDHSRAFKLIDFSFIPGADGVKVLKPVCVLPKWIYYFCQAIPLPNKGYARHFQYLKEAYLPLAPLSNQKLIVEKIEELFSHIDVGVEGLKQAKSKLQQYRQSVLKDAVTGKLTEQWRAQNTDKLESADVFLDKILEERRICWEQKQIELYNIKGKLPKTDKWKEKYPEPKAINWLEDGEQSHLYITLEHLKYYSIYGPRFSSNDYSDDGVLVLRTSDIDEYGRVNRDTAPKLSLTENEYRKYSVSPGDFLITRTGSIGTLAIYNDDYKAIPGAYLLHYKLVNKYVNPEYIYFVFKSPDYQVLLTQSTTGIGRPNLNAPTLEAMDFLLPSKMEQDEIVNIVKEKLKFIEKSEKDIEITLKKAVLQKSSVLAKAFSGELVPNASGESAKELLDKIILEKDSIVKTKPKRSTKRKKKVTSGRKPLLTVLNEQSEPLKPDELMQLAGFSTNEVEEFYIELAEIAGQVEQLSPETNQIKNWPYEKESEIKLKLKD